MFDADIQDLVDNPAENLACELKGWLDLSNKASRAAVARHIAALANYGGGYLVFGFDDDAQEMDSESADQYSRDAINGIVEKYLFPLFHCDVSFVKATQSEILHPVVWVPGHQSVPICSQADGPHDANRRPQGIKQGTYYIRAPGPKSEPIRTTDAWKELIRRCVLNEREGLLRDISTLLPGAESSSNKSDDLVLRWHEASHKRFQQVLGEAEGFRWPVDYAANHYQLSYRIVRDDSPSLKPNELVQLLKQTNQEVRKFVWTGWSMFYPFSPPEIRPYFHPDMVEAEEVDVLETNMIDREVQSMTLPDFWRFSGLGYASLVRAYREDRNMQCTATPGEALSPYILVRELSEFLRHALIVSRQFEFASGIEIQGRWVGLNRRRIDERDLDVDWENRVSRANERTVRGKWSVAEVTSNWEEVVAALANPICRLFDRLEISVDWIRHESPKFRGHR